MYPLKNWDKLKRGYLFGQKTFYSNHHLGLDLIAPAGTPIYAWQDLEITNAICGIQGGFTAWIKCVNNIRLFRIMHLQVRAKKGKYKEGDIIGIVGNTGSATTGAHLHIDISKSGSLNLKDFNNFEDPEKYFKKINEEKLFKVSDPKLLKNLKEEFIVRKGKDIYTCLEYIKDPKQLAGLTEKQIVRINDAIYRNWRK